MYSYSGIRSIERALSEVSMCAGGSVEPVVRALASRFGYPGFKTCSDHSFGPWFNFPAELVIAN